MMLPRTPVLFVPLVLMCAAIAHADPDDPSNYDECIIDAMKGVSSDVAARAIIESCRSLFPDSQQEAAPQALPQAVPLAAPEADSIDTTGAHSLTADELARLGSRAKVFGDSYRVMINNGNPHLTLTEVTIAVWDDNDPAAGRTEYSAAVQIPPQTSAEVKYTVRYRGDETGWSWAVVAARGVE